MKRLLALMLLAVPLAAGAFDYETHTTVLADSTPSWDYKDFNWRQSTYSDTKLAITLANSYTNVEIRVVDGKDEDSTLQLTVGDGTVAGGTAYSATVARTNFASLRGKHYVSILAYSTTTTAAPVREIARGIWDFQYSILGVTATATATADGTIDYENWTFSNVASDGPYRAGTNITFGSAAADGSVTINTDGALTTNDFNTFAELQAMVADKTLVNEEDVATIDANWVNTAYPWADNEVADNITCSGYIAIDAGLTNLASVSMAADKFYYTSADNVHVAGTVTAFGRSLIDDAAAVNARSTLGLGTANSPQFTGIELGHAYDTTLTRASAGDMNIEGNIVYRAGGTDVPDADVADNITATSYLPLAGTGLDGSMASGATIASFGSLTIQANEASSLILAADVYPRITLAEGANTTVKLSDGSGASKLVITDTANLTVASIDSDGGGILTSLDVGGGQITSGTDGSLADDYMTKQYIDNLASVSRTYYMLLSDASDIGGYYTLSAVTTTNDAQSLVSSSTTNNHYIVAFATDPSEPGLTRMSAGTYRVRVYAKKGAAGAATFKAEGYLRTAGGSEYFEIDDTQQSGSLTQIIQAFDLDIIMPTNKTIAVDDRWVIKLKATVTSGAPDITIYTEAEYTSYLAGSVGGFSELDPLALHLDGSTTMTGDYLGGGQNATNIATVTADNVTVKTNLTVAGELVLPVSTNPVTTVRGSLAYDSNDYALEIHDAGGEVFQIPTSWPVSATIMDPDTVQATEDAVIILSVHSSWAPHGIDIIKCGIVTDTTNAYSVVFEEWSDPATHVADIETVAQTADTYEGEDNATIDNPTIEAGNMILLDLPTTDKNMLTAWFVYYMLEGD